LMFLFSNKLDLNQETRFTIVFIVMALAMFDQILAYFVKLLHRSQRVDLYSQTDDIPAGSI
jgi:hypothetical protein